MEEIHRVRLKPGCNTRESYNAGDCSNESIPDESNTRTLICKAHKPNDIATKASNHDEQANRNLLHPFGLLLRGLHATDCPGLAVPCGQGIETSRRQGTRFGAPAARQLQRQSYPRPDQVGPNAKSETAWQSWMLLQLTRPMQSETHNFSRSTLTCCCSSQLHALRVGVLRKFNVLTLPNANSRRNAEATCSCQHGLIDPCRCMPSQARALRPASGCHKMFT